MFIWNKIKKWMICNFCGKELQNKKEISEWNNEFLYAVISVVVI